MSREDPESCSIQPSSLVNMEDNKYHGFAFKSIFALYVPVRVQRSTFNTHSSTSKGYQNPSTKLDFQLCEFLQNVVDIFLCFSTISRFSVHFLDLLQTVSQRLDRFRIRDNLLQINQLVLDLQDTLMRLLPVVSVSGLPRLRSLSLKKRYFCAPACNISPQGPKAFLPTLPLTSRIPSFS
jgi:hypothetical protein